MKTTTQKWLQVVHILCWIIFVGLCLNTGILLTAYIVKLINPSWAANLYQGLDLSALNHLSELNFNDIMILVILLTAVKAVIFYSVIEIFSKINFVSPFSLVVANIIRRISYLSLSAGVATLVAIAYLKKLNGTEVLPASLAEYLQGGEEFVLFGSIIYVIAVVFKRGVELQDEHGLTV
ncbi:MAG: hypothetical protein EOO47_02180 [Flavobacterium sp.]|nr:MAG: hypothetical protein EOO47_02180 [Flavobacterium sp.]